MSSLKKLLHLTDDNCNPWFFNHSLVFCTQMEMNNQTAIINYFTDDEWDALFEAICEYQDHGPEESDMSAQIQSKITKLFAN